MEGEEYALVEKEGAKHVFPSNFLCSGLFLLSILLQEGEKKTTAQGPPAKVITHIHVDSQRNKWSGWLCAGVSEDFGRRNWKSLYQRNAA